MTDLEAPCTEEPATWPALYLAVGPDVADGRPTFTGDVYADVVPALGAEPVSVIVLQHPCALRVDGVRLVPRVLVAELRSRPALTAKEWTTFSRWMPLPGLHPQVVERKKQLGAAFLELHIVDPSALVSRVACLSELGVNTLMQRWTHHNSRVIVETTKFGEVTGGPFAEAELVEEWCLDRAVAGLSTAEATAECHQ